MNMKSLYTKLIGIKTDFEGLFFKNEYRTLSSQSSAGLLTLIVILLLTFLALGFSIGGLEYLDEKMNNPYTNWLDFPVAGDYKTKVPEVEDFFSKQENLDKYGMKNYGKYRISFAKLEHNSPEKYQTYTYKYRTFEPNSDIILSILNEEDGNVLAKNFETENIHEYLRNTCGIIITQKVLQNILGVANYEDQKLIRLNHDGLAIYLPIIAVVKELPNKCDFACTPRMLNLIDLPIPQTNFILDRSGTTNILKFVAEMDDVPGVEKWVQEHLPNLNINKIKNKPFIINESESQFLYEIVMSDYLEFNQRRDTINYLLSKPLEGGKITSAYYDTDCPDDFNTIKNPSYIAFNFNDLLKVRDFKDAMKANFGIEISMTQVEAKDNFALVSQMTYFISIVLFGFSLASIVFYVDSLLKTHLQKVKNNLGTLKAFGLTNKFLINSYIKIVFTFLILAILIAYTISFGVDIVESLLREETYFNLVNTELFVAIGLIILFSLYKSYKTISKILTDTPGNLIYNR